MTDKNKFKKKKTKTEHDCLEHEKHYVVFLDALVWPVCKWFKVVLGDFDFFILAAAAPLVFESCLKS